MIIQINSEDIIEALPFIFVKSNILKEDTMQIGTIIENSIFKRIFPDVP